MTSIAAASPIDAWKAPTFINSSCCEKKPSSPPKRSRRRRPDVGWWRSNRRLGAVEVHRVEPTRVADGETSGAEKPLAATRPLEERPPRPPRPPLHRKRKRKAVETKGFPPATAGREKLLKKFGFVEGSGDSMIRIRCGSGLGRRSQYSRSEVRKSG